MVNQGFWSHLRCSGRSATIFSGQGIFKGAQARQFLRRGRQMEVSYFD